nr:alpha/beta fold hydrolase [Actinomadura atramentaria]
MFTFTSDDGLTVHVGAWPAPGAPRGVVQIAHGMGEHGARYGRFARTLNGRGYAVYAADHRGHGRTAKEGPGTLGDDGWNRLVGDQVRLTELLRARHPGVPVVLVGHSMGSFAAQQYVLDHADLVDGLVLTGTTALDALLAAAEAAGGSDDRFAAFNAAFEPARTPFDWLSRDEAEVDAYLADPFCGFALDPRGMRDLDASAPRLADATGVPADLPLYVAVGDRDPLNGGLALSDLLVRRYREAGLTDVTYRAYAGARHEILNETNRDEVESDLVAWIDRVTG